MAEVRTYDVGTALNFGLMSVTDEPLKLHM
jgi:hypothetical protein